MAVKALFSIFKTRLWFRAETRSRAEVPSVSGGNLWVEVMRLIIMNPHELSHSSAVDRPTAGKVNVYDRLENIIAE